jgi:phage terminase large subunit
MKNMLAPYNPLPWQVQPWRDRSPVILLAGPGGTGKSRLAAEKLHGFMLKYPNATGLALRKTRQSMINSTVLFLERTVIGRDPRVKHLKDAHRFEYTNGSILAYGGMADEEQREQIRSIGAEGRVDIVWMEEAVRFVEDDFQEVTGRMRGIAASWMQVILSTNPGPPSHWINQRLILGGAASVYDKARPEDNPHNPLAYLESLKRLTGIMGLRLRDGKWVQAEGLVYPEFDLDNLTDDEPLPGIPIELGYDDGYVDPRAILFVQKQPSQILVFDELYHSRHLTDVCVQEVVTICGERYNWQDVEKKHPNVLPEIAVGSPEAKELQGKFRIADIPTRFRVHEVVEGIKVVRELILDGNGYRTLKVNRRCKNFIKELTEGYQYPPEGMKRDNEKPLDGNDHAADALRYWSFLRAR